MSSSQSAVMAADSYAWKKHTFAEATAVTAVDSHTYEGSFPDDWCIGTVPHGGVVCGNLLSVARLHFNTTLSSQNQPHTLAFHADFLRRTQAGPCSFKVVDTKLGRQTSVIHITLSQGSREEVVCYITRTNFDQEEGITLDTDFALHPSPPPVDLEALGADRDKNWYLQPKMPFAEFRKASTKLAFHFPREESGAKNGTVERGMGDQWARLTTGEKFTNETLGFYADMFPMPVESYRRNLEDGRSQIVSIDPATGSEKVVAEGKGASFWYPTVLLNLDFKKALPEKGVEWLFSRCRAKQIKNGRMDLEIVIMDTEGDVVAVSHHICLAVSASRNTAARRTEGGADSKM